MQNFSDRLKNTLKKKGLSQTKVAKMCGVSQQSLNYTIKKGKKSPQLAVNLSNILNISPEWLISGKGRPEIPNVYAIPIIHSAYMLKKYLNNALAEDEKMQFTFSDSFLGNMAFAYLIKPKELVVCADNTTTHTAEQFLSLAAEEGIVEITATSTKNKLSFPIIEWRKRTLDF